MLSTGRQNRARRREPKSPPGMPQLRGRDVQGAGVNGRWRKGRISLTRGRNRLVGKGTVSKALHMAKRSRHDDDQNIDSIAAQVDKRLAAIADEKRRRAAAIEDEKRRAAEALRRQEEYERNEPIRNALAASIRDLERHVLQIEYEIRDLYRLSQEHDEEATLKKIRNLLKEREDTRIRLHNERQSLDRLKQAK